MLSFDLYLVNLVTLASVVVIDIALAGDNALIIGVTAARLPAQQRQKAIIFGILVAAALRILCASFAVQLLAIVGLLLAGGFLLLWVAWKMWSDLRLGTETEHTFGAVPVLATGAALGLWPAIFRITVADFSMSLDNVLAVAGTARHNAVIMVIGLILSIALMGVAATFTARLMARHAWLGYVALGTVTVVALSMIYEGGGEVLAHLEPVK